VTRPAENGLESAPLKRRLSAILSADAAGYSRLMGADESATVAALDHCRAIFSQRIEAHDGRVVDTAGDNILAAFDSVLEAVKCAVAVQSEIVRRNQGTPDEGCMRFRIGINLGDIIVKPDGTIYGDDVNIAARLQALAEAGGVVLSASAHEHVRNRLALSFEDMGEQTVRNIAAPVRAFRLVIAERSEPRVRPVTAEQPAAVGPEPAAGDHPKLPDKPSIAVQPFRNLGGDPAEDYFSDGITEDIVTELSRFRSLFVIGHNSSIRLKDRPATPMEIGRELGVHYVLQGSVRRAGNQVRITAQLADATTGAQLWAQRYDHELENVFAVQADVAQRLAATLPQRLEAADLERTRRKSTANMVAYDYLLRGKDHHHRVTREDNALAIQALQKAIEIDPNYAHAYAWLGCTLGQAYMRGYAKETAAAFGEIQANAERALALDDDDSECHRLMGEIHLIQRRYDLAEFHADRAFSLNANDPRIVSQRGELYSLIGRADEAVGWIERAMRLDPYFPERRWFHLGRALFCARRYREAAAALNHVATADLPQAVFLAASLAMDGGSEAAKAAVAMVTRLRPDFDAKSYVANLLFKHDSDREHLLTALATAGLGGSR